jgi:transketolase
MLAPKLGLNNIIAIVDRNNLQGYGRPDELVAIEPLTDKFASFGWDTIRVNGHDHETMAKAFMQKTDKPMAVICDTVKGKGVSFMEDEFKWHYFIVTDEVYEKALKELED